jgi:hypothetical protein
MSAEMMPAAAEMRAAKSVSPAMSAAVPAAMATAVTSSVAAASVAAASGDCVARQRQHEGKNRNSQYAP